MKQIRRILVAVDLGPSGQQLTQGSQRALGRASWAARQAGATLTILHARTHDEYWDAESETFINGRLADEGPVELERTCARLVDEGIDARLVVGQGIPWLAIVREVLRQDIDLVVAAKRTTSARDGRRLGTVAHKLLRKCPCLVWLEDIDANEDPRVVLAATDLSKVGDAVVDLAAVVAHAFEAELHVVHAFSLTMEAQMQGDGGRDAFIRDTTEAARRHIEDVLAGTPGEGKTRLHIGLTSPTQAILEGMRFLRPGLIVMGTVSRGGVAGLLMGNTAERLIDRIDCAMLTVKPDDFVCPVSLDDED